MELHAILTRSARTALRRRLRQVSVGRINENFGNIEGVMNGDLGRIVARLQQDEKTRLLAGEMASVS